NFLIHRRHRLPISHQEKSCRWSYCPCLLGEDLGLRRVSVRPPNGIQRDFYVSIRSSARPATMNLEECRPRLRLAGSAFLTLSRLSLSQIGQWCQEAPPGRRSRCHPGTKPVLPPPRG